MFRGWEGQCADLILRWESEFALDYEAGIREEEGGGGAVRRA